MTADPQARQSARRFLVQECPEHGIIAEGATISGFCPVIVGDGDNCALWLPEPFTVEEVTDAVDQLSTASQSESHLAVLNRRGRHEQGEANG